MSNSIVGFYASKYMIGDKEHQMVSSKFQPTYARRAFPCFDEPQYKAKFTVKLVIPGGDFIALSNMDQATSEDYKDNQKLVTFKESVDMSSYLVVFAVCEFKLARTEQLAGTTIPFSVYTAVGQEEDGKMAFDVAKKITEFYIGYFGVPYPLPKLDMVAIPEYPTGATEHWGLITFRQSSMLFNTKHGSTRNRKSISGTISHELAHMVSGSRYLKTNDK